MKNNARGSRCDPAAVALMTRIQHVRVVTWRHGYAKILLLYHAPTSAKEQMAKATPEQAKAGMDLWMNWAKKDSHAIVDFGTPLDGATRIQPRSTSKSEGTVVGYSILQGDSRDAIEEILPDHPHFHTPRGLLELFEFLPMPGI
jgi:hypothetical protein